MHRVEVLVRSQIDQDRQLFFAAGLRVEILLQGTGDLGAPEIVKIFTALCGQLGAHLEAIGLDQVQRLQYPVQPGEDAYVLLRPGEIPLVVGFGGQPHVYVAFEREQRLFRVVLIERCVPLRVAFIVEIRQLAADVHEFGDICG